MTGRTQPAPTAKGDEMTQAGGYAPSAFLESEATEAEIAAVVNQFEDIRMPASSRTGGARIRKLVVT